MNEDVEIRSLGDLEKISKEAKTWQIKFVVIGGYAVRAYTKGYRYTKDIDAVIPKTDTGKLIGLLKSMNYRVRETEFGIAGNKKVDSGFIDLHISLGDIRDITTNTKYPAEEIIQNAATKKISGFYEQGRAIEVKTKVASLEDMILLKLIPSGREKDVVDIISMMIDNWSVFNLKVFSEKCSKVKMNRQIRDRILWLIALIRRGEARSIWLSVSGHRLMKTTEDELIRNLKTLEQSLK